MSKHNGKDVIEQDYIFLGIQGALQEILWSDPVLQPEPKKKLCTLIVLKLGEKGGANIFTNNKESDGYPIAIPVGMPFEDAVGYLNRVTERLLDNYDDFITQYENEKTRPKILT